MPKPRHGAVLYLNPSLTLTLLSESEGKMIGARSPCFALLLGGLLHARALAINSIS